MINTIREIISSHILYRRQILHMAKTNLKSAYRGTKLGWGWSLVRPLLRVTVYYLAFDLGLRKGGMVNGFPYVLWFIAGFMPWFFISRQFSGGAGAFINYRYLITKIRFPLSLIPTFTNLTSLFLNSILMVVMCILFICMGYPPTLFWLQILLYSALMFLLFWSWEVITGIISTMSKDFLMTIRSLSSVMIWLSGVFFKIDTIENPIVRGVLMLNPLALIVRGFRNATVYNVWFWENPEVLILLGYIILLFLLALWLYKRFSRDVPDYL